MGFGHRVYKTYDPRAVILKRFSRMLAAESSEPYWFSMSEKIEQAVIKEKGLYPNVDFYSASTYHYLGIETGLFTPIFAMSRVVGWAAHVIEQHSDNRLIRPSSEYVGPPPGPTSRSRRGARTPLPDGHGSATIRSHGTRGPGPFVPRSALRGPCGVAERRRGGGGQAHRPAPAGHEAD